MRVDVQRLALVFGIVLAVWHATWALLVAVGLAQPLIDFVFWAHFLSPPYHVVPFEPLRALLLVGLTGVLGWAMGAVAGLTWNVFHRP